MITSANIDLLAKAFVAAQTIISNPGKDAENPAFKRDGKVLKYTSLTSVLEEVRLALNPNGIAVIQDVGMVDGRVTVTTRLLHESGQWIEGEPASAPLSKQDAQGVGSAVTYLRRYSLMAALGIAPGDDDDGNKASTGNTAPNQQQPLAVKGVLISEMTLGHVNELMPKIEAAIGDPTKATVKETNLMYYDAMRRRQAELVAA